MLVRVIHVQANISNDLDREFAALRKWTPATYAIFGL